MKNKDNFKKRKTNPPVVKAVPAVHEYSPRSFLKQMMLLVITAFAFALYANTLTNDYAVDDHVVLSENHFVRKGISGIPEILTTRYMKGFWEKKENSYRPLSLVMFAVEWQMAPGKPFIGHLVNVLLYMMTGILLFLTMVKLLPKQNLIIPFITTLLFIAHPVHTEVVANIKSRDEILCFLFLIASVYSLISYIHSSKVVSLISSLVCFFLALLSKENAITWLAIVPLVLHFFTSLKRKKIIAVTAQFAGVAFVYLLIRFAVLKGFTNDADITLLNNSLVAAPDALSRFASAMHIMGKYMGLLFFPHPLVSNYGFDQIKNVSITDVKALVPIVVYSSLFIYALKTFLKKDLKSFGILFFLVTISLVSNIFFLIVSPMGERFLYTPSLGFCIAIAILITEVLKTSVLKSNMDIRLLFKKNLMFVFFTVTVLALFSFKTISRNSNWKNDVTLLENDIPNAPECVSMHYGYGSTVLFQQAIPENDTSKKSALLNTAIEHLGKCVSIYNGYADAQLNLAIAYGENKDTANAIKHLDLAAKDEGDVPNIDFYARLGDAYHELNNGHAADIYYDKALQIDPGNTFVLNNYAYYLSLRGEKLDQAEIMAKQALDAAPQEWNNMDTYGYVLYKQKHYSAAKEWIGKALSQSSENNGSVLEHYGDVLFQTGDSIGALQYWEKAKANHVKSETIDKKIKDKGMQ